MLSLLTVSEYANSYDLTVLETAKLELGIEGSSQDEKISLLIHQVSDAISTICNRVFAEETVQEVFRLNSGNSFLGFRHYESRTPELILRRRPISSIVSLVEDGVTVDSGEYECNFETGILYRLTSDDYRQSWLANKVTVTYVSGFLLLDDLPYDLEKACLLWIKSLWAQNLRSDLSVKVEDVPDIMRKEFFDSSKLYGMGNPPPEVMVLLNPYVEVAIR